jgi:chemotaxis signal transduction protein
MLIDAAQSAAGQPAESGPLVVTFRAGRQRCALPLSAVLQVVRLPALTVVPDAPAGHCGLLNLRGSFLPVLDARALLGEPPDVSLTSQVIVLADGPSAGLPALGILVDEVDTVRRFPAGSFTPLAGASDLVSGILREQDGAAVVIDPEPLAARAMVR